MKGIERGQLAKIEKDLRQMAEMILLNGTLGIKNK
jgi:hypothetical protein